MNRRQLLQAAPALAAAMQLRGQAAPLGRLRTGLVAYSFRTKLGNHSLNYIDLISYAADQGLDGLDCTAYWFPDAAGGPRPGLPSDQYVATVRRAAYKNAIHIYSLTARVNLYQATPEQQTAAVEDAKKWVDVAQRLGASHMRVFGGNARGATNEQAIPVAAEVLKRLADYSGSKGIFIGVEDDGGLSATAEPTIAIVKAADSPWAGVNLDVGNFPKDAYNQITMCAPYATNVHFKVKIKTPEGTPENVDTDRVLGILVKGGYKGYVSIEYEENDPDVGVPKLAADLIRGVRKIST